MADETGGMPHGREYAEFLRRIGVRDRTGLELQPRASLVELVADSTRVTRPILVPMGVVSGIAGVVAGEWSGLQIQCHSNGGAFVECATGTTGFHVVRSSTSILTTVTSNPTVRQWATNDVPVTTDAAIGSRATDPILIAQWQSGATNGANMLPPGLLYLGPGQYAAIMAIGVGVAITGCMVIREIG